MTSSGTTSAPTLQLVHRSCPVCQSEENVVVARGRDFEYATCDNELSFVRCESCRAIYLEPRPALEDFDVIYPEHYYATAEASGSAKTAGRLIRTAWNLLEKRRASSLLELLSSKDPASRGRVLDIGCGDGRLLRVLRRSLDQSWQLTGVERGLSKKLISTAADDGITLIDGTYEETRFPLGHFDLIVAQQVIEHTVEPGEILAKACAELRPRGHVLLDTPNYDGLDRRLFSDRLWGGYHFPRHLTLFTPETFARLANDRGFDVVQVVPMLSPVFWIMTLHNAFVDRGAPRQITARLTYRSLPLLALATLVEIPTLTWNGSTSNMRVLLQRRETGTETS